MAGIVSYMGKCIACTMNSRVPNAQEHFMHFDKTLKHLQDEAKKTNGKDEHKRVRLILIAFCKRVNTVCSFKKVVKMFFLSVKW